jgi:hypothetical protein
MTALKNVYIKFRITGASTFAIKLLNFSSLTHLVTASNRAWCICRIAVEIKLKTLWRYSSFSEEKRFNIIPLFFCYVFQRLNSV